MAKIVKQFRLQKSAKIRKKGEIKILKTLMEYASLCKKSEKNNDEISRKCQKTGFSGIFLTFSAGNVFFSKTRLCYILGIAISHHCAKN